MVEIALLRQWCRLKMWGLIEISINSYINICIKVVTLHKVNSNVNS